MAAALPMNISKWISVFMLAGPVLVLADCSDHGEKENERLRTAVERVHDEAMAKIGYMFELSTELKTLPADCAAVAAQQIEADISALEAADRAMFDWMHQYQSLFVDKDIRIDNEYRRTQLVLITEVGRLTEEAISAAEQTHAACQTEDQP
jgi:hypothetical protein